MPSRQNLKYGTPSTTQPLVKPKVSTMSEGDRFIQRILDSATFGISGEVIKKMGGDVSFRESRAGSGENVADFVSTALGFFVPGIGWVKGIQALSKAPKLGKFASSLLAKKATPEIAQGALKPTLGATARAMGKTAASRALEGAAFGAAYTVPQLAGRALNPQDYTAQQNLGLAAQNIIGGAVFDPLLGGAGDVVVGAGKKLFTPKVKLERAEAPTLEAIDLEPEFQPTPAVISKPVEPTAPVVAPEIKVEQPKPVEKPKPVVKKQQSNQKEIKKITKENKKIEDKIAKKEKKLAKYEQKTLPPSFDPKDKVKIDKEINVKEQERKNMLSVRNSLVSLNNKKIRIEELKKELSKTTSKSDKISINNQIESLELQIKEDEIRLNELKQSSLFKDVENNLKSFDATINKTSKEIDALKSKSFSFGKYKITPEELQVKKYAVTKTKKELEELKKQVKKIPELKIEEVEVQKPKVEEPKVEQPKVEEPQVVSAIKVKEPITPIVEEVKIPKTEQQRYNEAKVKANDLVSRYKDVLAKGTPEEKIAFDKELQSFEKTILPIVNNTLKKVIDEYKANPSEITKEAIVKEYQDLLNLSKLMSENSNLFSGKKGLDADAFVKYRKSLINNLPDDDIVKLIQVRTPDFVIEDGVGKITAQPLDKETADFITSIALDRYKNWETKDFKGVGASKLLMGFSTVDRVLEKLFDEVGLLADSKNLFKRLILDGYTQGKGKMNDFAKYYTDGLEEWRKKGFERGSELSKWTQIYGEGLIDKDKVVSRQLLEQAFGKEKADLIVEFDAWNKKTLKELLDAQNTVLRAMGEKEIIPIENYYRHIYDPNADSASNIIDRKLTMSSGAGSPLGVRLKDVFKEEARPRTAEEIARTPSPESRFNPTRQRRTTELTEYDATRGMADYIMHATYQIHISPYIKFFKSLTEQLEKKKNPKLVPFQNSIDSFIKSLQGVRQAGDTFLDKYTSENTIKFAEWLNQRIKRNNVIGSLTATLAQITNLAPAAAALGFRKLAKGISETIKYGLLNRKGLEGNDPASKSAFLKERFDFLDLFRRFETSMFEKATNATAKVTLEYADAFVTKSIWYTAYKQALEEGVPNPILRADDITRKLVAGRGIGEKSAFFNDRLTEAFLPFQIDVANIVSVSADIAKRDPVAFANLMIANYVVNGLTYGTVGRTYLFDPIKATKDGLDAAEKELEEENKYKVIGGRMAGEFLKSIPGGQLVGSFGTEAWRKSFFGQSDPTKYGSGLLAQSLWENPAEMMVYQVALPFGGVQARRMVQSLMAISEGGVYTTKADPFTIGEFFYKKAQGKPYSDELKFLTNDGSFFEVIKPFIGGVWSTEAGQEYIEKNRRALSPKQTEMVRTSKNPVETYNNIMYVRERDRLIQLIKEIQKNKEYSAEEKKKYISDVRLRLSKLEATR